jgi:hypothetical protein
MAWFLCKRVKRDIAEAVLAFLAPDKCHIKGILDWYALQKDRALATYQLDIICGSLASFSDLRRLIDYVRRDYVFDAGKIPWNDKFGGIAELAAHIPLRQELAIPVAVRLAAQRGIRAGPRLTFRCDERAIPLRPLWRIPNMAHELIFIELLRQTTTLAKVERQMEKLKPIFLLLPNMCVAGSFVLHMLLRSPTWEPDDINIFASRRHLDAVLPTLIAALGATDISTSDAALGTSPEMRRSSGLVMTAPGIGRLMFIDLPRPDIDLDICSMTISSGSAYLDTWVLSLSVQGLVSLYEGRFSCVKKKTTTQERVDKYTARGFVPDKIRIEDVDA